MLPRALALGPQRAAPARAFRRFLPARGVSWAGSAVTLVALPILLFARTGSATASGVLVALEALPYLVLGLPAGALADRWDRRRTLTVTSVGSAVLVGSIPIADAADVLTTAHLMVVACLSACAFVFFDAAAFGALPALVGSGGVAAATGSLMTVSTLVALIGPPVAGVLVATVGAPEAIGLDAASYTAAALLLARLPLAGVGGEVCGEVAAPVGRAVSGPVGGTVSAPVDGTVPGSGGRVPARTVSVSESRRIRAEIAEGLAFIRTHPLVRPLTLLGIGIGNSLGSGAVLGLVVVVAVRRLGLDTHGGALGLVFAAAALGSLAAGLLLSRLQARIPVGRITLGALAANWLLLLAWAQSTHVGPALFALAGRQFTNSLVSLNGIVVRQQVTPDRLQARVNTTARMIAWGGQPVGAALAGVLADSAGTRVALLVVGSGVLVSLAAGLASPALRAGGRRCP
nr:MFS transporter [Streptomyces sp. SID3343]